MSQSTVDKFYELFEGYPDGWGTEDGGFLPRYKHDSMHLRMRDHLHNFRGPIGIYPMHKGGQQNLVGWGCVDFDEGEEDSRMYAADLVHCLEQFQIVGWVERSRSKGYHVWVFIDGTVQAKTMRDALLAACQIVGAPTKEINPKQYELAPGKIGNYVRLPYPGALGVVGQDPADKRVMLDLDTGQPMSVSEFVDAAHRTRMQEVSALEYLASLYVAPTRPPINYGDIKSSDLGGDAIERLTPLARKLFEEGPLEGQDRSTRLWKLICLIQEGGLHDKYEAAELLLDADKRWGKFDDKGTPIYLATMVAKAWGE